MVAGRRRRTDRRHHPRPAVRPGHDGRLRRRAGRTAEGQRDAAAAGHRASEIEAALRGLKLFPLLDGFRGRPKADLDAAIDAILAIADFALANADALDELDINPLIVCAEGQGAWVADALMRSRLR